MNEKWRIERLAELATIALSGSDYDGQASGRVRDVPDVRTIRYYTTLGLIDRPAEMQGRTAYYTRRHLLQLVAIKRLQAQGLSLVDVQKQMLGIGDSRLAELADLTGDVAEREPGPGKGARAAFWAQATEFATARLDDATQTRQSPPTPMPAIVVPLGEGVSLLIEDAHTARLDHAAMQSLTSAAANLRAALRRAGIVKGKDELETGGDDAEAEATGHPQ